MSPMKRMGMKTAMSEKLIETTVKPTSAALVSAACIGAMPSSMWRVAFSSTTMASSTTKPVATMSAISERLFRLKPARYMKPKVAMIDTGTAAAGMSVARTRRRNAKTTRMTSPTAMMRVFSTSESEARMVAVRSMATPSSAAAGIEAERNGMRSRTRCTVSRMLAFGSRLTMISTAGRPFASPALRTSCTESTTSATSERRTAAPFLYETMSGRYSEAWRAWSLA